MATELDQFAEKVLHCAKTQCPFHQRTRPGAYPKFSYGNAGAKAMAVFQNPGSPTHQEQLRIIETVTVEEMREWANAGVSNWLTRRIGNLSALEYNGRDFLHGYYLTQAYRCPDPPGQVPDRNRREAERHCSSYLREEIRIIKPEVILCFGLPALKSVRAILAPNSKTPAITPLFTKKKILTWSGIKVFPLLHPDGFWKYPTSMSREEYTNILRWYVSQIENG